MTAWVFSTVKLYGPAGRNLPLKDMECELEYLGWIVSEGQRLKLCLRMKEDFIATDV